jgi:hypothetical protein
MKVVSGDKKTYVFYRTHINSRDFLTIRRSKPLSQGSRLTSIHILGS